MTMAMKETVKMTVTNIRYALDPDPPLQQASVYG